VNTWCNKGRRREKYTRPQQCSRTVLDRVEVRRTCGPPAGCRACAFCLWNRRSHWHRTMTCMLLCRAGKTSFSGDQCVSDLRCSCTYRTNPHISTYATTCLFVQSWSVATRTANVATRAMHFTAVKKARGRRYQLVRICNRCVQYES
jgi:hypothetical protein